MTPEQRRELDDAHAEYWWLVIWAMDHGDDHGVARRFRDYLLRRMAALAVLSILVVPALAHESWISRGGLRSTVTGEWCCGEGDCFTIQSDAVQITAQGYRLFNREDVPFSEAQPSPDGQYWRCKRPDGSRRCFFAPPPNS